jgi:type IV fimbrial biogenesis protein FimT
MVTTRCRTGMTVTASSTTQRGFTLVELLTAMAVAGIVGMFVVPALNVFAANAALRGTAYDLMAAMTLARSEAVKHMSEVIVCRSADPMAASPSCGGADGDWTTGWIVFASRDGDDDYDAGTDVLLGAGEASGPRTRVLTNAGAASHVEFRADGSLNGAAVAALAICDDRGEAVGKRIDLALVGRPGLTSATPAAPLPTCNPGG